MTQAVNLISALAGVVGTTNIITNDDEMLPFLVDWRGRYRGRAQIVIRPRTTEEVAAVVRLCAERRVPIVPQGGNTGMCGGATPDDSGYAVVVNLGRMNRIRGLDLDTNAITVDAGCVLADVQRAASEADRLFPMGLGSEGTCQIGGNISTNSGGTAVLRYGNMRELVLGLEAVLPDGRIWDGLRALRKDNTGYDLKQLFIGAEGTLGLVTGAVLKLFPKPTAMATALVAVHSVEGALRLLSALRGTCGERISAFEIMSDSEMEIVLRQIPGTIKPIDATAPFYVFLDLADSAGDLDLAGTLERALANALDGGLISDAVIASSSSQAAAIWRLRHSVSEANKKEGVSVSHDTSVPISRIPEFVRRVSSEMASQYPNARRIFVGHIGDGNIHFVALFPKSLADDLDTFEKAALSINRLVHDITASLDGSISAEHGIGQSNRKLLARYTDPLELKMMAAIKRLFDPLNIMNPGKVMPDVLDGEISLET
jgi:FAD/FMN-containing dehydrogenase